MNVPARAEHMHKCACVCTDMRWCRTHTHTRRRTMAMLTMMEHERADQVSSYLVGTSSVKILKFPIRSRRQQQLQSGSLVGLGQALASSFIAVPLM